MNRSFTRTLQILFVVLDLFVLNIAYLFSQDIFKESAEAELNFRYTQFWIVINLFWFATSWLGETYASKYVSYFERFLKSTLRIYCVWAIICLAYLFLPRLVELSKGLVLTTITAFFIGLILNRFLYLVIQQWVKRKIQLKKRILILGYSPQARKLAAFLEKEFFNINIVGFVDDKKFDPLESAYPIFQDLENALNITKDLGVNEVYSTIMPENNSKVYKLMQQADKELIRFKVVPDFSYFINRPVFIEYIRHIPVLTIRREPLENVNNRFKKRTFDIIFSLFVTIFILSWLIPLLGLFIYLESPGPILFVQQRSGKNNIPFGCYKFRSMRPNVESNSKQATRGDNRVTRIGRFMRKTSLDEFPQFLNVLKGEMSIVGPRPHMLKHTEDYSAMEDQYMIRQFLKPGITGWAQVNGYRGEITELYHIKKRVEYDLWYLENWDLWLDLRIIFQTVYNVFEGEENAF
jgi:putative colanic acid biosysnthesis UDP-glucose lipid carrier transferase